MAGRSSVGERDGLTACLSSNRPGEMIPLLFLGCNKTSHKAARVFQTPKQSSFDLE